MSIHLYAFIENRGKICECMYTYAVAYTIISGELAATRFKPEILFLK